MSGRRHAALSSFAQRLTPAEIAVHWFRRASDYGKEIAANHPDFPRPAPDGLYLLEDVRAWFDCYHGRRQRTGDRHADAEQKALEIARHGRG